MTRGNHWIWPAAALLALGGLTACKSDAEPTVCATYRENEVWYEPDGEPFHDDDPCDTDDADNVIKHPKPKPLKTARQPAPPKPKTTRR